MSNISRMDNDFPYHVEEYGDLLRRHIDIEDEVFPVLAADHFSDTEIALIMTDFETENGLRDLNAALKLLDKVEMQIL